MSRRWKITLILGALLLILCGGGGWLFWSQASKTIFAMEQDAELFGDYAVEVIGEKWDVQDLRSVASAELLVTSTDEQKASWLKQRQGEAGAFVKIKNRKATLRASEDLAGKASLAAFYAAEVEFEKGERRVVLRLQKREIGDWQVVSVSVGPAAGLGKEADTKS